MFDSISVAEFDPGLLRESRQTEIDVMDQLDVYRKRPRQWASSIPVIRTKCVDEGDAKQLEYYSRLCEKEFERLSSNVKCVSVDEMSHFGPSHFGSRPDWVQEVACRATATVTLLLAQS